MRLTVIFLVFRNCNNHDTNTAVTIATVKHHTHIASERSDESTVRRQEYTNEELDERTGIYITLDHPHSVKIFVLNS